MAKATHYPGTNKDIEEIAASMRAKAVKDQGTEDVPTLELLENLVDRTGGTITLAEDPFEQEIEGGSLVIRGPRDYTIFLSPYTTPLRDNFTIAHELGHYVLHFYFANPRPDTPLWFARHGSNRLEWQANRFAAALLMPQDSFQKAFRSCEKNLYALSGKFDVSLPAVETRAKSLGLLKEDSVI